MGSLWGKDFEMPNTKIDAKELSQTLKSKQKSSGKGIKNILKSSSISIEEKLSIITQNVLDILGVYSKHTVLIKTKQEFIDYIEKANTNGIIAIDTETNNSLFPVTCKLMGVCIYTPDMKNAYIPINHEDLYSRTRLSWQLTETDVLEVLSMIDRNTKILAHNGKFDYEVLKCTTGWEMPVYWDTSIAARMLNENEKSQLKIQYITKIDPTIEKYSIDGLFSDIEYAIVDPQIFALYAATDSFMTFKLYELQLKEMLKEDNSRVFDVFMNIEMPVMTISAEMELSGIMIDTEYAERLRVKYHKMLDDMQLQLDNEVSKLAPVIEEWRRSPDASTKIGKSKKTKSEQLHNPPALSSPTQLSILLYDVLKVPVIDEKNPRGTGGDILEEIDLPLCKLMVNQKKLAKLTESFLDTLPTQVCEKDGRIHAEFHQLGTVTGRFSCTNPNLQQIPSKNHEIRKMFMASPGNVLVGSDFSSQEPRLLAALSQDKMLLKSFKEDKDVYATIGTGVFKNDYWDNMEHFPDGTKNEDGNKRRKKCKTLLLGMMYGMGSKLISTRMGVTVTEGKKIIEDFYNSFTDVKDWKSAITDKAYKTGFVEDAFGRRRRLTDLLLPKYSFEDRSVVKGFNPFLGTSDCEYVTSSPNIDLVKKQLDSATSFSAVNKIKSDALARKIKVIDNSGFIAKAERQCVNAAVQGSAASMTKKAMISIYNDEEMKKLGFKLLIGVHDELIGECPECNADKVADRLSFLMTNCVPDIKVNFKCDAEIEKHWYDNQYAASIIKEYNESMDSNDKDTAFNILCQNHIETLPDDLIKILEG